MEKATMKGRISELDYDSLPPTLRRKYFSTLERLRLASAADPTALPQHGRCMKTNPVLPLSTKCPRRPALGRTSTLTRLKSHRFRKSLFATETYITSQIDTQWFLSLPPAIQRKKFSREEQVILAGKEDTVILDAADEKLHRLRKQRQKRLSTQSLNSLFSLYQHSVLSTDSDSWEEEGTLDDSVIDMDEAAYDSFRWLEDDEDLDLSLDDYHTHIAQAAAVDPPAPLRSRKESFRRTLSITSLSFGRSSTLSSRPPGSSQSSVTASSSQFHSRKRSNSRPFSAIVVPKHDPQGSQAKIQPSAKHYQDPEARLKLRVYLASPQKFDEAIEFGFPSLTKDQDSPSTPAGRTFLDDDHTSFFDDMDHPNAENESIASTNAPCTPVDPAITSAKPSRDTNELSLDSSLALRPRMVHKVSETYAQSSAGSREMTLHMTLTRPDLRSTGRDSLITKPANNLDADALKLEDLLVGDDHQNIWDTMPEQRSRVKKAWRKIKRRN